MPLGIIDRVGAITIYSIRYNSTQWNLNGVVKVSGTRTNIILENLVPFTTYDISIKAATSAGFGPNGPIVSATTHQAGNHFKIRVLI